MRGKHGKRGQRLKMAVLAFSRFRGNAGALQRRNRENGLAVTSKTLPPLWTGERMDMDLAILGLECRE